MANIKSQIKRNRQNEKRRIRNRADRSELRTRVKNAEVAFAESADDAELKLKAAIKGLDKAAQHGLLHKNTVARRKSRLIKRVRATQA